MGARALHDGRSEILRRVVPPIIVDSAREKRNGRLRLTSNRDTSAASKMLRMHKYVLCAPARRTLDNTSLSNIQRRATSLRNGS